VFTSFALTFGLLEFRRKAPFLSPGLRQHYSAEGVALLVLSTTVPSIHWREFCDSEPAAALA